MTETNLVTSIKLHERKAEQNSSRRTITSENAPTKHECNEHRGSTNNIKHIIHKENEKLVKLHRHYIESRKLIIPLICMYNINVHVKTL